LGSSHQWPKRIKKPSRVETEHLVEKPIDEVRNLFLTRGHHKGIHIETVVIRHPDEDHCIWLADLIKGKDTIENLILGGLPESYYQGGDEKNKKKIQFIKNS
jgi:hypothetical protein